MAMTPQWTVWCENKQPNWSGQVCCVWDQASGSKKSCEKDFKESGWAKIKGKWICPSCNKQIQEDKKP